MNDQQNKLFERLFSLLNMALQAENGEKENAISLFSNQWKKVEKDYAFDMFISWLETESFYKDRTEEIRPFLMNASKALKDKVSDFSTTINEYFASLDEKNKQQSLKYVLNDVCVLYYKAAELKASQQNSIARTLEDEAKILLSDNQIDIKDFYKYRSERRQALVELFKKADIISATTNQERKDKLEAEFSATALEYGFITPDGSATTDEFNTEYGLYILDREACLHGKKTADNPQANANQGNNATTAQATAQTANAPDDENAQEDDQITEDNLGTTTYSAPLELKMFPLRDSKGEFQAIKTASSYSEALQIFWPSQKEPIKLSVDFDVDGLGFNPEEIIQHANITNWTINSNKPIKWRTANNSNISNIKLNASSGDIEFSDLDNSEITLSLSSDLKFNGVVNNTIINAYGKMVYTNEVYQSSINSRGAGVIEFLDTVNDVDVTSEDNIAFSKNITGGKISATNGGKVIFTSADVTAENVEFVGAVPESPALSLPAKPKKKKKERDKSLDLMYKMERFLMAAFRLGQPGFDNKQDYSKIAIPSMTSVPYEKEKDFIFTLLSVFATGYEGQLFKIKLIQGQDLSKIQKNDIKQINIFPIFPDHNDAKKKDPDPKKIKGKFHYRIVITNRTTDLCNGMDISKLSNNETGYPKDRWERWGESSFMVDVECSPFDTTPTIPVQPEDTKSLLNAEARRILTNYVPDQKAQETFSEMSYNKREASDGYSGFARRMLSRQVYREIRDGYAQAAKFLFEGAEIAPPPEPIILGNNIFKNCAFSSIKTNFYAYDLSGSKFQDTKAKVIVQGDLSSIDYIGNTDIEYTVDQDTSFSSSNLSHSKISILHENRKDDKFLSAFVGWLFGDKQDSINLNLDNMVMQDSELLITAIDGDKISAKSLSAERSKITINNGEEVDLSSATFTNCKIKIKGAKRILLPETVHTNNKIEIICDELDATNAEFSGDAEVKGNSLRAIFQDATIGTALNVGQQKLQFSLKSESAIFDGSSIGNVTFANDNIDTKSTDWSTVSIVGNIDAELKMARALYPLFGKAVNMIDEVKPAPSAGNKAQPARVFAL